MQKYFVNKIIDNIVSFDETNQKHIVKVMRMKIGNQLISINNNKKYLCELISIEPVRAKIIEEIINDTKNNFELNIFLSSIKESRIEIAIAKATELNANNFYIFNSKLSQNNIKHNFIRYEKIIKESAEQSNRVDLMQIKFIEEDELLQLLKLNDINFIAHLYDKENKISEYLLPTFNKIGIIIGPEGGFNNEDIDFFSLENVKIIKLSKTILRTETAVIYMLSVINELMLRKV